MAAPTFAQSKAQYKALWESVTLRANKVGAADAAVRKIIANWPKYEAVTKITGVPSAFIAVCHMRESSNNFAGVLHNGEHIIGKGLKTRLVPKGRGPFTSWEQAAVDALKLKNLHRVADWPIERILYECESFNGWGYFWKKKPSPYLWAGTNHYTRGKYVADGQYDPNHIDTQLGTAIVLKRLEAAGINVSGKKVARQQEPVEQPKETDVADVPAPIPTNSPVKSKTLWATILGGLTSIAGVVGGIGFDWKTMAVICAFIVVFLFVFIGRERVKKMVDS